MEWAALAFPCTAMVKGKNRQCVNILLSFKYIWKISEEEKGETVIARPSLPLRKQL